MKNLVGYPVVYNAVKDGIVKPGTQCAATITQCNDDGTVSLAIMLPDAQQLWHRHDVPAYDAAAKVPVNSWQSLAV